MNDDELYGQPVQDRDYVRYLLSRARPRWYFNRGLKGRVTYGKPAIAAAIATIYPFWVAVILGLIAGYWILWALFWPVRIWARRTGRGWYATPDEPADAPPEAECASTPGS